MPYLLSHFTSESLPDGEQVYFSVSPDGLKWTEIHNSQPVLKSNIGQKGVRDPFITKSCIDNNYYIIATDLCIGKGTTWADSVRTGSHDMIIWSSPDLIHWSDPWTYTVSLDNIGCVWAPEAIYDKQRDCYLVFWASMTYRPGQEGKQIIYQSQTKDFKTFTPPQIYIERPQHIIDTTIVEEDGIYYRFSKDESIKKCIKVDYGNDLLGPFTPVQSEILDNISGVEGPTCYKLQDGNWCLLADRFLEHKGYFPILTKSIKSGNFVPLSEGEYDMGKLIKRHGSVIEISTEEYKRLTESGSK